MDGSLTGLPLDLSDGVVRLRALCADDVSWIVAACSDADIVRWTPIP
jgi:hypothetical protein